MDKYTVPGTLEPELKQLEQALDQAVTAVRTWMPESERSVDRDPGESPPPEEIQPEMARDTATRLQNAAEMGYIGELRTIAEALEAHSLDLAPIGRQIADMVDSFDMEGILKLAGELWKASLTDLA